jgi:hypothetical protein
MTNALATMQAQLPDEQMIGKYTKPQGLVIVGLLSLIHQIANANGWTVKEKAKREGFSEYEIPHVTLKFYDKEDAQAQYGRGIAQITDPSEYAPHLYRVWEGYKDTETYSESHAKIVRTLALAKRSLKHLHSMVYVYTADSVLIEGSLMFQGTVLCGDQFRAELSFW